MFSAACKSILCKWYLFTLLGIAVPLGLFDNQRLLSAVGRDVWEMLGATVYLNSRGWEPGLW